MHCIKYFFWYDEAKRTAMSKVFSLHINKDYPFKTSHGPNKDKSIQSTSHFSITSRGGKCRQTIAPSSNNIKAEKCFMLPWKDIIIKSNVFQYEGILSILHILASTLVNLMNTNSHKFWSCFSMFMYYYTFDMGWGDAGKCSTHCELWYFWVCNHPADFPAVSIINW